MGETLPLSISWTNVVGPTSETNQSFRVGLYLSSDTKIEPGKDILIGYATQTVNVANGNQRTVTISGIIPPQAAGSDWYVGAYADYLNQVNEGDQVMEGDNGKAYTNSRLTVPGPALHVTPSPSIQTKDWQEEYSITITVTDDAGNPVEGAGVTVDDRVRSLYFGPSLGWTTDRNGQYTYGNSVPTNKANNTYPIIFGVTRQGYQDGTASPTVTVQHYVPIPKLSLDVTPKSGVTLARGDSQVYAIVAEDPSGNRVQGVAVTGYDNVAGSPIDLTTDQSGTTQYTLHVPFTASYGSHSVYFDGAKTGYEDADRQTRPVTVNSYLPDLLPTALTLAAPTVTEGHSLSATVTTNEEGPGNLDLSKRWRIEVYLSSDQTLDASDMLVYSSWEQSPSSQNIPLTIPSDAGGSTYWVLVEVNRTREVAEASYTNNVYVGPQLQVLMGPRPDLAVNPFQPPFSVAAGATFQQTVEVFNKGTATAAGGWSVDVYLSSDNVHDESDTLLDRFTISEDLAPASVDSASALAKRIRSLTIPATQAIGRAWLIVHADADGQRPELDESNNWVSEPLEVAALPAADLAAQYLSGPTEAAPGSSVQLEARVINAGTAPLTNPWSLRVLLSKDGTVSNDEVEIASLSSDVDLAPGVVHSETLTGHIPDSTADGDYTFLLQVDPQGALVDPDTSNNVTPSQLGVSIQPVSTTALTVNVTDAAGELVGAGWSVGAYVGIEPASIEAKTDADGQATLMGLRVGSIYRLEVWSPENELWGRWPSLPIAATPAPITISRTEPFFSEMRVNKANWKTDLYLDSWPMLEPGQAKIYAEIENPGPTERKVAVAGAFVGQSETMPVQQEDVTLPARTQTQFVLYEGSLDTSGPYELRAGLRGVNPFNDQDVRLDTTFASGGEPYGFSVCHAKPELKEFAGQTISGPVVRDLVLVHGFQESQVKYCAFDTFNPAVDTWSSWTSLIGELNAAGIRVWTYKWPTFGSAESAGDQLRTAIATQPTMSEDVVLVAHSMGGLVAAWAAFGGTGLLGPSGHQVTEVVTMGTPWYGTPSADECTLIPNFFGHRCGAGAATEEFSWMHHSSFQDRVLAAALPHADMVHIWGSTTNTCNGTLKVPEAALLVAGAVPHDCVVPLSSAYALIDGQPQFPASSMLGFVNSSSSKVSGVDHLHVLEPVGLPGEYLRKLLLDRTVPVASHVAVSPATLSLSAGSLAQLTATVTDGSGNAMTRAVSWSSLNPSVVAVDGAGVARGVVEGVGRIVAAVDNVADTATVTVDPAPATPAARVEISPSADTVMVGGGGQLSATVFDASGHILSRTVVWTSLDKGVASVDGSGKFTGLTGGQASIVATVENVADTAVVTVVAAPEPGVVNVAITPHSVRLAVGHDAQLAVTLRDAAGELVTRTVDWAADPDSVASVSRDGLVRGLGPGVAMVIASVEGLADTASVEVVQDSHASPGLYLSADSLSLYPGASATVTAVLIDQNGDTVPDPTITWSSGDATHAAVDAAGQVTARAVSLVPVVAADDGYADTVWVRVAPQAGGLVHDPGTASFYDDFNDASMGSNWSVLSGSWSLQAGALRGDWDISQAQTDQGNILLDSALYSPADFTASYVFERSRSASKWTLIAGPGQKYNINMGGSYPGPATARVSYRNGGLYTGLASADLPASVAVGDTVGVVLRGLEGTYSLYVNGWKVLQFHDTIFGTELRLGLGTYGTSYYDEFAVYGGPTAPAAVSFHDDFNDGDFTNDPTWTKTEPGTGTPLWEVVNGELHIARSNSGGSGRSAGLNTPVDIPVTDSTLVDFDVKVVSSSVRNGCGDACTEYPAQVRLQVETTDTTSWWIVYAYNDDGGQSQTVGQTVFVARGDAPTSQWLRGESHRVRDALPAATKIKGIWVGGGGWDFEAWYDNLEIRSGSAPPPPPSVASVTISPDSVGMEVGDTLTLGAMVRDGSGNVMSRTVTWSSTATGVATVGSTGKVTAVGAGTARLIASVAGIADTAKIVVTLPQTGGDIPAWIDTIDAATGDTVSLPVRVDMTATGGAIGAFRATMRFDTTQLRFVSLSTDFKGTFQPNTDSAAIGGITVAGINTSSTDNRDTTVVATLRLVARGLWGSRSVVALGVTELATTSFEDVTGRLAVHDGGVYLNPGAFDVAVTGATTLSTTESEDLDVRADLSSLRADIGALAGRVSFDPTVGRVDSVTAGTFGGTLTSEIGMQSDSGYVRFAIAGVPMSNADTTVWARLWMTGVGQGGDSTDVTADLDEVTARDGSVDLLPYLAGDTPLRVGVATGLWGDANRDQRVTALDALICLSDVVGKDVSQFDVAACDVAPDNGAAFTGRRTALDALGILSYVVEKPLPAEFRVGKGR